MIRAENPLAVERRDEVIAVSWAELRAAMPSIAPGVLGADGKIIAA